MHTKIIDNNRAFNQVFIASDEAIQLNILISWIVDSLKNRKYFIKVPIWMGYIAGYILDIIARFTNIISPFSLRRLKAMTRDVVYSNKKIAHVLNVKNKYGVQQGIKNAVEWYHKRGHL